MACIAIKIVPSCYLTGDFRTRLRVSSGWRCTLESRVTSMISSTKFTQFARRNRGSMEFNHARRIFLSLSFSFFSKGQTPTDLFTERQRCCCQLKLNRRFRSTYLSERAESQTIHPSSLILAERLSKRTSHSRHRSIRNL